MDCQVQIPLRVLDPRLRAVARSVEMEVAIGAGIVAALVVAEIPGRA